MKKFLLSPLSASCLAAAAGSLQAAELAPIELQDLVVSASGFEQKITDAPASISVISGEELKQKRVASLADALADVEGVDVSDNAGKTGGLNISIRGMGSAYTLILIDGRRQNAAGDITPNGFGETRTSFLPPISAIERIEVIRGPMSTLYGSDAMGGVVNIITKKVGKEWGGSVSAETTLQEHKAYGDSRATELYLSGPLVEDKLGLALRGRYFERDASEIEYFDATVGGQVSPWMGANPVESDIWNAGGRLTFTPTEDHDISLDYERNNQWYDNSEGQLGTLGASGGYEEEQRYEREQYSLAHTGRFGFGTLESSLMRNTTETIGRLVPALLNTPGIVAGGPRKLESENTIFDTKLLLSFGNHNLTVGGQYWEAEMIDGVVVDKFEHRMKSVFLENEWRMLDNLALTLGVRRDDHDKFGGHTSPRAYLVWNATDNWTLKGGVSEGFKAPDLEDLADGINGFGRQGRMPLIGNPDLQPETSRSSEFGVYFDNYDNFNANLTLFHNKFEDKLSSTTVDNCRVNNTPGCVDIGPGWESAAPTFSQAINVDEAVTEGVEVAGRWRFAPAWSLSANYTYTDTEQKSGVNEGWPLNSTPRHMFNTKLDWQVNDRLSTWLRGEYRSERFRRTEAARNFAYEAFGDYKAYTLFHLGGSYRFTENFDVSATIYNLFDKDFIEYKPYVSNAAGDIAYGNEYNNNQERRRLWLSATYSF
ncbi:TonB-dependent receptor domain-containing protein [Zestomonas carbonaria]|uniref:Colicin I receptor n=1 Tax=Zestomonas carbonaria TaxID=2762745 RepID=A0A7U7I7S3_9GAMM|nr:TonB-dependent receptor [Pseudomonas carbonaria]CAD5106406.1 Colicin I receptor [Pseudomonas carbonaria]